MNKDNRKWLCPYCGSQGVSSYQPLCGSEGYDYKTSMIEISDRLYNKLGYNEWKSGEYDRLLGALIG